MRQYLDPSGAANVVEVAASLGAGSGAGSAAYNVVASSADSFGDSVTQGDFGYLGGSLWMPSGSVYVKLTVGSRRVASEVDIS